MKQMNLRARIALLVAGALTLAACGNATAARWNGRGNAAFAEQDYANAQIAYEQAVAAEPARAQTLYNLGNTQYRQAAQEMAQTTLAEAAQAATGAAGAPPNEKLAAEAFFNLGNSRFAAADFAGAVDAYTETLRRTPDDMDAKVNLELALRKLQENQTPTDEPSPTPAESPTSEATQTPSPTPTPQSQDGSPTAEATPSPQETPSPEATATPEPNATASETATPEGTATQEGTATPDGTATSAAQPSPAPEGTPTAVPGAPTPDPATLPPGAMSDAQARQILEAATSDTQTLQERLQQLLRPFDPTVEKDW